MDILGGHSIPLGSGMRMRREPSQQPTLDLERVSEHAGAGASESSRVFINKLGLSLDNFLVFISINLQISAPKLRNRSSSSSIKTPLS